MFNFEPTSNFQYHLSSSVRNGQNTFQQGLISSEKLFETQDETIVKTKIIDLMV